MSLKQNDSVIFEAIESEEKRQHNTLELIASENFVSPDVSELQLVRHQGGGPGAGPIGIKEKQIPYLPIPRIEYNNEKYVFNSNHSLSIERVKSYNGNFGILVRAYTDIRTIVPQGFRQVSESAVLHANDLRKKLEPYFEATYSQICKHEFVLFGSRQKKLDVRTLDMTKHLLDFGYHPPTAYFPSNLEECMMIEPTETESKETLDTLAADGLELHA